MAPAVGEVGEVGGVGAVRAGLVAPLRVVVLVAPAGCRLADVDQAGLLASAHVADETGLCRGCALWWSAYVWWPCSAVRWARPELRMVDTWVPVARLPAVDRASPRGMGRGE